MTLTLRLSNSGLSFATVPSSVVQTGVKSLGCEKRMAQPSPIHWWKSMVPWVVLAVKFGASELIRRDMCSHLAGFHAPVVAGRQAYVVGDCQDAPSNDRMS